MKPLCFVLFMSVFGGFYAQRLSLLSAKDSLPIPFASLLVKQSAGKHVLTADANGTIDFARTWNDTLDYEVIVSSFGFQPHMRTFKGHALAQLKTLYLKPSDISLEEVIVTAQYSATTTDQSIQRIKVIDSEKIRQMAAVNLYDVMSNQLNVRLQQDNLLGGSISLQGIGGQNVKILLDGVPVIGRLDGNIDLSQINMNNVERIEFVEGPLSVQYGTNALAGTINIITKKVLSKKISAGLTSYYESIGTYNLTDDVSISHKKSGLQVSGGRNYFDGWNGSDALFDFPKTHLADSTRFKQWKPKEQYFVSAAYQYHFKKTDVGIQCAYFDEKIINRGYPRAPYSEDTFDEYYYTQRLDNSIFLKAKLNSSWSVNALTAFNYYNRIKKKVHKDLTTLDELVSPDPSDQDTSGFTQLMSRASFVRVATGSKMNYELGYDVNYQSAQGKRIEKNLHYMGDYAAFVTAEYSVTSKIVVKPGLRYAYNTSYATPLVPSLNIKWAAHRNYTLRASYAQGFRAPDIKELFFLFVDVNHNIVGNPKLKAEKSNNFTLSYNYSRLIKKCTVKLDASLFYNTIFNLITLAQDSSNSLLYTYTNIGHYKTLGLQLGNTVDFKKLIIQTGFNYTGRYNDLSQNNNLPMFSYSPEVQANVTYKFVRFKAGISLFYKYNGRLPGFQNNDGVITSTFISAYQMMDVTFNKFFWKDRINLAIGCKNILDVKNISVSASSGGVHSSSSSSTALSTGRNYFIKLAFNFCKV